MSLPVMAKKSFTICMQYPTTLEACMVVTTQLLRRTRFTKNGSNLMTLKFTNSIKEISLIRLRMFFFTEDALIDAL